MRMTGLEPARRGHQNLNLARLPIPPHPLIAEMLSATFVFYRTFSVMSIPILFEFPWFYPQILDSPYIVINIFEKMSQI